MVTVRGLKEEDFPQLLRLGKTFWKTTALSKTIPYDARSVKESIQMCRDMGLFLVAVSDDRIAGVIGGVKSPIYVNKDYIVATELFFWVEPEHRAKGLGEALISTMEAVAKIQGICTWQMVSLQHSDESKSVAKLYKKMGYIEAEATYTKVL